MERNLILRICFQFYQFTLFAMSLNEMKPGNTICPTDSRLRPDIRKLESGDIDGAALEKTRLEEKQRDARKSKKSKKGDEFVPRYECSMYSVHRDVYLRWKRIVAFSSSSLIVLWVSRFQFRFSLLAGSLLLFFPFYATGGCLLKELFFQQLFHLENITCLE